MKRSVLLSFIVALLFSCTTTKREFNIVDFGAKNDSMILSTVAIQAAIDECAKEGGRVVVPEGYYQTATLFLKSNVELHIEKGGYLLGSINIDDYSTEVTGAVEAPAFDRCLLFAEDQNNIKITGEGVINGRGSRENFPIGVRGAYHQRPMMFRMINCSDIEFADISLRNAGAWCLQLIDCSDIVARSMSIDSQVNRNNDGFDLDGCQRILIEDCDIKTGDDAICPKGTTSRLVEDLVVRNCRVSSHTSAFKLGTSSLGGFRNILIEDCEFYDVGMGAIKLQMVDEGILENVVIRNITMRDVEGPIFIRLGNRGRMYNVPIEQIQGQGTPNEGGKVGSIKNILISDITATVTTENQARSGIMITGIPGACIENVTLRNIDITFPGGVKEGEFKSEVAEDITRYPEQFFFGVLPSWGAFIRHAKDVTFDNVKLSIASPDVRQEIVLDDVENFIRR